MEINKKALKGFNKIKLRKINTLNESFLWKRGHLHLDKFEYSKCIEKVVVYLENYKNSPLVLFFREEDNRLIKSLKENEKWIVGYPNQGVIWKSINEKIVSYGENKEATQINLNSPPIIESLIKYYFNNKWKPDKSSNSSHIVENALTVLNKFEQKMKS